MDFKKDPKTDFADVDELSPKDAKEQAEALREGIEYHNRRYYLDNDPAIADAVFDRLFSRLQELEEAFTELRTDASPTRRVGVPPARIDDRRPPAPRHLFLRHPQNRRRAVLPALG